LGLPGWGHGSYNPTPIAAILTVLCGGGLPEIEKKFPPEFNVRPVFAG